MVVVSDVARVDTICERESVSSLGRSEEATHP